MPVMMYKGGEQEVVHNCLIEKMKTEGWSIYPPVAEATEDTPVADAAVDAVEDEQEAAADDTPDWAQ